MDGFVVVGAEVWPVDQVFTVQVHRGGHVYSIEVAHSMMDGRQVEAATRDGVPVPVESWMDAFTLVDLAEDHIAAVRHADSAVVEAFGWRTAMQQLGSNQQARDLWWVLVLDGMDPLEAVEVAVAESRLP